MCIMKVLLINPPNVSSKTVIEKSKRTYYIVNTPIPPLSLMIVASVFREFNIDTKILDLNLYEPSTWQDIILNHIIDVNVIGITGLSFHEKYIINIANYVKKMLNDVIIIVGGVHATLSWDRLLERTKSIDIVIVGEGENTLRELIPFLLIGRDDKLNKIKGLAFQKNKKITFTGARELITDLDSQVPFPSYDLIPLKTYKEISERLGRHFFFPYESSRGCPYSCIFCTAPLLKGKKWRTMTVDRITNDIKKIIELFPELKDKQFRNHYIEFHDSEFTFNKDRMINFSKKILNEKLDVSWGFEGRVNHLDDEELIKLLSKAGCKAIQIGVEAGYKEGLLKIGKMISPEQVEHVVKKCVKEGIIIEASFIIGFPWERKEHIKKTLDFAIKLYEIGAEVVVFKATPLPATRLYSMIHESGLKFKFNTYTDLLDATGVSYYGLPYEHPFISDEDIEKMLEEFYDRIKRAKTLTGEASQVIIDE